MAINKEVENEYGAMFKYHKLSEVRINADDKSGITIAMTVESYKDKQARIDGKQPTVRRCFVYGADMALLPFYQLLKGKFPEFMDGEDDMNNDFKKQIEDQLKDNPVVYSESNYNEVIRRWEEKEGEEYGN